MINPFFLVSLAHPVFSQTTPGQADKTEGVK
jgi:hypothetical protein